ncbi:MAG: DUF2318 domain-containing protein [Desulfobacterales bacterium]|nr:DUF2318 domain-containing protein [Desulfobacterales bacterium]
MSPRTSSALLITAVLLMFVVSSLSSTVTAAPVTQVTYPEKTFADGKARQFTYKTEDGLTIRYFIIRSSDGVIRAAFDACDVCWPENKGYSQKGDFMVCKNCGKQFPSARINEVSGGCNPAPLQRKVENGNIIIQVSDILQGKRYFDSRGVKR